MKECENMTTQEKEILQQMEEEKKKYIIALLELGESETVIEIMKQSITPKRE